jgi:primosomal protein N' (replication factor Y)
MAEIVEVAVELPVPGTYSYVVPEGMRGRALFGHRVLVPFGRRAVTGVVVGEPEVAPEGAGELRAIESLVDAVPAVSRELVELCLFVARYYEAPLGEVLRAALPAGTRISAGMVAVLTEPGRQVLEGEGAVLGRRGRELLGRLRAAGGSVAAAELAGKAKGVLEELVAAGLVEIGREATRARVRERREDWLVVARSPTEEERAALVRAPRRAALLGAIEARGGQASMATLRAEFPTARELGRGLVGAGLVVLEQRTVRDDPWGRSDIDSAGMTAPVGAPVLTGPQAAAHEAIRDGLASGEFRGYLLHGITGSGKTEVYLHVIADALAAGKTAIVLVPEISLTPQLAARFRARFGEDVAVLHSGLPPRERLAAWRRLRAGEVGIALGARSAVFAPLADLGVIVVDEEHDSSFKQDEGVRYHARDVALVRCQKVGAVCMLGSATPSLESYYGAERGRLALLELPARATGSALPPVEVIDLRDWKADPESMLTAPLVAAIEDTIARGEQVILFLNRRGWSTFVLCVACGHAFRCRSCAVSLTYHRFRDHMLCHYCGHSERVPETCPACHKPGSITRRGLGTEKIADAVAARFPTARVARLDRDSAAGTKIGEVLGRVARREVDVLVGTQMVTKGHDFPGVTLVGVLMADTGLNLPDFRAAERTFQLLTQVAGRAGRGERPGRVMIQSYRPDVAPVACAAQHDFVGFYRAELEARRELDYPPFGHLVAIRLDGEDGAEVASAAGLLAARARGLASDPELGAVGVLGPSEAPLARLKGRTRWHLWLRGTDRRPLRRMAMTLAAVAMPAGVRLGVDVDPLSAL